MLKKETYTESPIDTFQLENISTWQKRNGHVLCRIEKLTPLKNGNPSKYTNSKIYILKGSIKYQSKLEVSISYCEDTATQIGVGECIYLPKGDYYYWVGKEGVELITVIDDLPQKYFDIFNAVNINID